MLKYLSDYNNPRDLFVIWASVIVYEMRSHTYQYTFPKTEEGPQKKAEFYLAWRSARETQAVLCKGLNGLLHFDSVYNKAAVGGNWIYELNNDVSA